MGELACRLALSLPIGAVYAGRFDVRQLLGEGAFGTVMRCFDRETQTEVALKLLHRAGPDDLLGFKREFRRLADVHHPNLVRLGELLQDDEGRWGFSMELVHGQQFGDWVRTASGDADLERTRHGLRQLAECLDAVHQMGLLHRDVKPANVRVTPQGRVVLLDFGLVASLAGTRRTLQRVGAGTPAYMAPEQVEGQPGPPADFYALGVMLFEVLEGRLPFEGHPLQVLLSKQGPPPPVSARSDPLGVRLAGLCEGLLRVEPSARPSAREVLDVLSESCEPSRPATFNSIPAAAPRAHFIGREAELDVLDAQWRAARETGLRLVLVEGDSGIGKSALVEQFAEQIARREPRLWRLSGRCHASERVRFKAVDGIIDDLWCHLRELDRRQLAALIPPGADTLAALFPVLAKLPGLGSKSLARFERDPAIERREAFVALTQLVSAVALQRPLLLTLDDLQWGDPDSLALIEQILAHRPAPPLLWLATVRPQQEADDAYASSLRNLVQYECVDRIRLEPLASETAIRLAASLTGLAENDPRIENVAREGAGHPWMIGELTRLLDRGPVRGSIAALEAALCDRLDALGASAARLSTCLAIAAAPQPSSVVRHALGLDADVLAQEVARLRSERFVRQTRSRALVCYHDRVREALAARVPPAERARLHHRLAEAWVAHAEVAGPEMVAESSAHHFREAALPLQALPWLEQAATYAAQRAAYAQAATLYEDALRVDAELGGEAGKGLPTSHRRKMTNELAAVLASAGRAAASARVLLESLDSVPQEERARQQTLAAQQLLQSGEIAGGLVAAEQAFTSLRLRWPRSAAAVLGGFLWQRTCLAVAGGQPASHDRSDPATRAELDTLWRLGPALSWADLLRGAELSARHLRRALQVGEPQHVALALCAEAVNVSMQNPRDVRSQTLLSQAAAWIERRPSPLLLGYRLFAEGTRLFLVGEGARATVALEEAERIVKEQCAGEAWLLANVRGSLLSAWFNEGRHQRWAARADEWIEQAKARGDAFARATFVAAGQGAFRHLLEDDPERALAEVDEAMAPWRSESFGLQHFMEATARYTLLSYQGGTAARDYWEGEWPRMQRSLLSKVRFVYETLSFMRIDASLRAGVSLATAEPLVGGLRGARKCLDGATTPWGIAYAGFVRSQLEWLWGDREQAARSARSTHAAFVAMGDFRRYFARCILLRAEGDVGAADAEQDALDWLASVGWRDPARAFRFFLPASASWRSAG